MIAGGITPENVHLLKDNEYIHGIDMSTGVESKCGDNIIKDNLKVRKICRIIKNKLPT